MGAFHRLKAGLAKTRQLVSQGLQALASRPVDHSHLLERLEEILIQADVGIDTAGLVREDVASFLASCHVADWDALLGVVRARLRETLALASDVAEGSSVSLPRVIMVVGVNGGGKTTTVAKLASRFRTQGARVLLGAADTFRAAAVEQLATWAGRAGADVLAQRPGADPASVAFDAVAAAKARGYDVVILDTAGRLHTRVNLMDELSKIKRVVGKAHEGAPHEVLLVVDATTGQNALSQVREFHRTLGLTGIVLAKLDGTAKGGVVFPIVREFGVPIRWVGVGEDLHDLEPFAPDPFLDALLAD